MWAQCYLDCRGGSASSIQESFARLAFITRLKVNTTGNVHRRVTANKKFSVDVAYDPQLEEAAFCAS